MKLSLPSTFALGVLAALAASTTVSSQQATPSSRPQSADQSAANPAVTGRDADNTRVNKRDRGDASSTTPMDQPNASVDLVAEVRKAIVGDDNLSMQAHNVKVIVDHGIVTLRGPVASASEKARVGQLAASVRGVTRVDNQLDIATDDSR